MNLLSIRFSAALRASGTRALLPLLLLMPTMAHGATLTRGPYLQLLTPTSVTIVWNTDTPAACSVAIHPLGAAGTTVAGGTAAVCAVAVTGLSPGTDFGYVPRADGGALRGESVFHTDDPKAPYTFLVVGDTGGGGATQLTVRDRMLQSPADFILHTGDMIYDVGDAASFDPKYFTPYRDLIRQLVFWPTLGNHDVGTAGGQPWRDAFYTPANNPAGSENYYSFDYGNAHVAVIDSNASTSPGSAQYQFLDADLSASAARWKFVAFHHTIYSSGSHGSNTTIQRNLVPLFDTHAVDIVFMGHDHHYERTVPMVANQEVPPGEGTVYVTTGGGGKGIRAVAVSSFTAYVESAFHFTRVSVAGDNLVLEMVRDDGAVRDQLTLTKGAAGSPTPVRTRTPTPLASATPTVPRTATPTALPTGPTATRTLTPTRTATPRPTATGPTATRTLTPTRTPTVTATMTPRAGTFIAPIADTYVEIGAEATWDHGGSDHLDVDASPLGVTYLAFDLRGQRAPIQQALLRLHVTNRSADGGRVYRLVDVPWTEGTGTGVDATSAGGPGLKWIDIDLNGDGVLDAADASPLVPSGTVYAMLGAVELQQDVEIDVTAALQLGAHVYTFAIASFSGDGVTYSSREHPIAAQRPQLYLLGGTAPTAAQTTARTATPIATTTTVPPATPSRTVTPTRTATPLATATVVAGASPPTATPPQVQPTSAAQTFAPQADTYIESGTEGTWSHGGSDHLDVDMSPAGVAYLRFDLTGLKVPVSAARLKLHVTNPSVDGGGVYRIANAPWTEGTATGIDTSSDGMPGLKWLDVDTNGDGVLDAADGSPLVPRAGEMIAAIGAVPTKDDVDVDVTQTIRGGGAGIYTFAITNGSNDGATFASRENPVAEMRPVLVVGDVPAATASPAATATAAAATTTATPGSTPVPATQTAAPTATPTVLRTATATPLRTVTATPLRTVTATPLRTVTAAPPRTATPTVARTPAPGSGPFACLSQPGPVVTLSGTRTGAYSNKSLASGTKIDARGALFIAGPANLYPLNVGGGGDVCVAGGKVAGNYDRNATWDTMHSMNNAGVRVDSRPFTVDGVRIDNVEDGVRPINGPFLIRATWMSYVRDDCVENDHVQGGVIEDSLFDGCYVAIAERPSPAIAADGYDGRNDLLTIRGSLLRLQPLPGPRGGVATDLGHGPFFKWDALATKLALHDNVFMAEQVAESGAGSMGIPSALTSCSNNVMVWLGPGAYPTSLPSCFTVTKDRRVWDDAVARWKRDHAYVVP